MTADRLEPARAPLLPAALALVLAFGLALTSARAGEAPEDPFVRLYDTGAAWEHAPDGQELGLREGWELLPEGRTDHDFSGDAVMANNKVALVIRRASAGVDLYSMTRGGWVARARIESVPAASPATISRITFFFVPLAITQGMPERAAFMATSTLFIIPPVLTSQPFPLQKDLISSVNLSTCPMSLPLSS